MHIKKGLEFGRLIKLECFKFIRLKKGAMFGLDARIALAIFGALSVISGAALYSAIKEAKLVSFHESAREISKAFEALYLDTGTLQLTTDMYHTTDIIEDNGINGWKGPYLSADARIDGSNHLLENISNIPASLVLRVRNAKTSDWAVDDDWLLNVSCANSTDLCALWLQFYTANQTETLGAELDARFDDGVANTGTIRYGISSSHYYIYLAGFTVNSQ